MEGSQGLRATKVKNMFNDRKPGVNKRYKQSVKSYSEESLIVQHSRKSENYLYFFILFYYFTGMV